MKDKLHRRKYFSQFRIDKFSYYDGVLAFKELKIGKKVELRSESKNFMDKFSVAIYFDQFKLGYIPREKNKKISNILKTGFDLLEARIQWIDKRSYPEGQVGVVVFIKYDNKKLK